MRQLNLAVFISGAIRPPRVRASIATNSARASRPILFLFAMSVTSGMIYLAGLERRIKVLAQGSPMALIIASSGFAPELFPHFAETDV